MEWTELLKGIVKSVGVAGMKKAEVAMTKLADQSKEPWKKAVIEMVADSIGKYGMSGIGKVEEMINSIADGEKPNVKFASLKAQSDFLAALQNMEADEKKKMKDFFSTIGDSLSIILKAVIAGLMSA